MAIEQNLTENLDRRAIKAGLRVKEIGDALWHAEQVISTLTITNNRIIGLDDTTLHAARVLRRLLRVELDDNRRFCRAAEALSDEAHGVPPSEEEYHDEMAELRKAALNHQGQP